MTKADKMFKELGFIKHFWKHGRYHGLNYTKNGNETIYFNLENKTVSGQDNYSMLDFSIKEIEAILEKMKELGW